MNDYQHDKIRAFVLKIQALKALKLSGIAVNLTEHPQRFDHITGNLEQSPHRLRYMLLQAERAGLVARSYEQHNGNGRGAVCFAALQGFSRYQESRWINLEYLPILKSRAAWIVFRYVYENDACTMREIADAAGIGIRAAQTIIRILDRHSLLLHSSSRAMPVYFLSETGRAEMKALDLEY